MSASDDLTLTRTTLHRVAAHIVARSRVQATGRFSLRVTPGGFGTPEFGDTARRVRVSGVALMVESDAPGGAAVTATAIDGSSLADLAAAAGVDLGTDLEIGHDAVALGDVDAPLTVDAAAARSLSAWYSLVVDALDRVALGLHAEASPTLPRLWPEHFDVALEAVARPGLKVNLGGSPGDGFCAEPYLYVGPWTSDRPGDPAFWNAPFGAIARASALQGDTIERAVDFLLEGYRRLALD